MLHTLASPCVWILIYPWNIFGCRSYDATYEIIQWSSAFTVTTAACCILKEFGATPKPAMTSAHVCPGLLGRYACAMVSFWYLCGEGWWIVVNLSVCFGRNLSSLLRSLSMCQGLVLVHPTWEYVGCCCRWFITSLEWPCNSIMPRHQDIYVPDFLCLCSLYLLGYIPEHIFK